MKLILSALLLIPHMIFAQEMEQDCNFKPIKINDSVYHVYLTNTQLLDVLTEDNCLLAYMHDGRGKPDGSIIVFDNFKKKRWLVNFKEQKRHKELLWYTNGKLQREFLYKDDIIQDQISYKKDGIIDFKVENQNSGKASTYYYYKNGILKRKIEFDSILKVHIKPYVKDAKIFSIKEWYINGSIKKIGSLWNETYKFGNWTYYDENGKITKTQEFTESNGVQYNEWD